MAQPPGRGQLVRHAGRDLRRGARDAACDVLAPSPTAATSRAARSCARCGPSRRLAGVASSRVEVRRVAPARARGRGRRASVTSPTSTFTGIREPERRDVGRGQGGHDGVALDGRHAQPAHARRRGSRARGRSRGRPRGWRRRRRSAVRAGRRRPCGWPARAPSSVSSRCALSAAEPRPGAAAQPHLGERGGDQRRVEVRVGPPGGRRRRAAGRPRPRRPAAARSWASSSYAASGMEHARVRRRRRARRRPRAPPRDSPTGRSSAPPGTPDAAAPSRQLGRAACRRASGSSPAARARPGARGRGRSGTRVDRVPALS